jgi:hypothetical protein
VAPIITGMVVHYYCYYLLDLIFDFPACNFNKKFTLHNFVCISWSALYNKLIPTTCFSWLRRTRYMGNLHVVIIDA